MMSKELILGDVGIERCDLHYQVLLIDLTKARQLKDEEIAPYIIDHYNRIKILYAPSAFSIILNSKENDAIPVQANQTFNISNILIKQLYITNDAADEGDVAVIFLSSRWP